MVNASPESPGVGDVDQILYAARGAGRIVTQLENTENAQQKMAVAVEANKSQFTKVLAEKVAEAKGFTDGFRVSMGQVQSAWTKYAMEVQRIADEEKAAKRLITGWESDIQAKQKAYAELSEVSGGEGETWVDTKGRKYGDKDTGRVANQYLRTIEDLEQKVKNKWDWIKTDLYAQRLQVDKAVVQALQDAQGDGWPRVEAALQAAGVTDFGKVSLEQKLHALEKAFEQAYGSDVPEKVRDYLSVVGMMGASAVTAFAEKNRRAWMYPLNATNDVAWVSAWWKDLPENTKQGLPTVLPGLIGNLNGIPFATARNTANRALLRKLDAQYSSLDEQTRKTLDAIAQSLNKPGTNELDPNRYVVSFDLSEGKPLAAIAIGNLDTAGNVTWNIPGMGTNVTDGGLEAWTTGAQALYDTQNDVNRGGPENAVVSWVGYDTPVNIQEGSVEVARNDKALVGAAKLRSALDGFNEFRQTTPVGVPVVNVVAHSYGTPTATYALARTNYPVNSYTLLASAGVDMADVPNTKALNVSNNPKGKPAVYYTNAAADWVAPGGAVLTEAVAAVDAIADLATDPVGALGRFIDDTGKGVTGEPRVQGVRRTPGTNLGWGAERFSSEGGYDSETGVTYQGVNGHITTGNGTWNPVNASEGHGYLDSKTESIRNTALISTGQGEKIKPLLPWGWNY